MRPVGQPKDVVQSDRSPFIAVFVTTDLTVSIGAVRASIDKVLADPNKHGIHYSDSPRRLPAHIQEFLKTAIPSR